MEETRRIVVLDSYAANPGDLSWEPLKEFGEVIIYDRTRPEETIARAADADIVLTNKVVISSEVMEHLPRLRYIGVLATGYNVVDIKAAQAREIVVTNIPAYSTMSVAQMVFAHLLTVTNRTEHYAQLNRYGRWSQNPDFCYWDTELTELAGKTMGIVGLGNIGQRVALIALAFGMNVKALTSKQAEELPAGVQKADLEELLATSDVVSLHCPLTDGTHHLINAETLARMKPTAILVNTGRGPLVNEQDVAMALKENRLRAYCADVLSEEPPRANPLLNCENAFITPHIAWATKEARTRLTAIAINNVKAFVNRQPINVITV
jgi:glycerate dehydrogenase